MRAVFDCDSLNNVILQKLAEHKSKNMYSDFDFDGGRLNYKAVSRPDTVFAPSDTIYIDRETPVRVEVVKTEYKMSVFQTVFFYIGIISAAVFVLWLIVKLKLFKLLK